MRRGSPGDVLRVHSYECLIPSRRPMEAPHPSASSPDTSSSVRGVPSGIEVSNLKSPRHPMTSGISSASSRIERSSPTPTCLAPGVHQSEGGGIGQVVRMSELPPWRAHPQTSTLGEPVSVAPMDLPDTGGQDVARLQLRLS